MQILVSKLKQFAMQFTPDIEGILKSELQYFQNNG